MLPKSVREEHGWGPGTEFVVESTPDGLRLRAKVPFPRTALGQVFGSVPHAGHAISLERDERGHTRRSGAATPTGCQTIATCLRSTRTSSCVCSSIDDESQGALARQLFESDEIWIAVTVLLEAAWVLESVYELSAAESVRALRRAARPAERACRGCERRCHGIGCHRSGARACGCPAPGARARGLGVRDFRPCARESGEKDPADAAGLATLAGSGGR